MNQPTRPEVPTNYRSDLPTSPDEDVGPSELEVSAAPANPGKESPRDDFSTGDGGSVAVEEGADEEIRPQGPPRLNRRLAPLPSPWMGEYAQWTFRDRDHHTALYGGEPVLLHTSTGLNGPLMRTMASCADLLHSMEGDRAEQAVEHDSSGTAVGSSMLSWAGSSPMDDDVDSRPPSALRVVLQRLKELTGKKNPNGYREDWLILEIQDLYKEMMRLRAEQSSQERFETTAVATVQGSWHTLYNAMKDVDSIVASLPKTPSISLEEPTRDFARCAVRTVQIPQGIAGRRQRYFSCALRSEDSRLEEVQVEYDPSKVDPRAQTLLVDEAPDLYSLINESDLYEGNGTASSDSTTVVPTWSMSPWETLGASVVNQSRNAY
jgi:hypothetical protein